MQLKFNACEIACGALNGIFGYLATKQR